MATLNLNFPTLWNFQNASVKSSNSHHFERLNMENKKSFFKCPYCPNTYFATEKDLNIHLDRFGRKQHVELVRAYGFEVRRKDIDDCLIENGVTTVVKDGKEIKRTARTRIS